MECAADTDPQLGYSTTFGLFLILLGGVGCAALLLVLEGVIYLVVSKKKRRTEDGMSQVAELVGMTERERLLGEIVGLKRKLKEKEELIELLKEDRNGNN